MKRLLRIFKFIAKAWNHFLVRLAILIGLLFGVCAIAGALNSKESFWLKVKEVVTSGDVIVAVVVGIVTLIVAHIAIYTARKLEDSYKIEADPKKIIVKYSDHVKRSPSNTNFFIPDGAYMYLSFPPKSKRKRRCFIHHGKKHTEKRELYDEIVDAYLAPTKEEMDAKPIDSQKDVSGLTYALYLSEINIFANVEGKVNVRFEDSNFVAVPPDFVRENALALLEAHKHSNFSNNPTIRLKNVAYDNDDGGHELTLYTERTQYFDMLITNRCMDFKLKSLVSLRDVYESANKVSPLAESQLSNQLGINGLIFTSDGYLLLEKRGYKKVIWKGKLAQPISLAMKKSAVKNHLNNDLLSPKPVDGVVTKVAQYDYATDVFNDIILDTLKSNFGFTKENIKSFDASENLLGIARDLLEGGKPNMYFYVILNMTAEECKKYLEKKASESAHMTFKERKEYDDVPNLNYDKLDSDYYFININDIGIDFKYRLKVKAKKVIKVYRKFRPMVNIFSVKADGLLYRTKKRLGLSMQEECGEALLACLYYVGACKDRLYAAMDLTTLDSPTATDSSNADNTTTSASDTINIDGASCANSEVKA